jgi:cell shape-determining protein MreC
MDSKIVTLDLNKKKANTTFLTNFINFGISAMQLISNFSYLSTQNRLLGMGVAGLNLSLAAANVRIAHLSEKRLEELKQQLNEVDARKNELDAISRKLLSFRIEKRKIRHSKAANVVDTAIMSFN